MIENFVANSATNNIERVFLYKDSTTSASAGAPITGLDNTSSGLIISVIANNEATTTSYTVTSSNVEAVGTLGTYSAPTSGKCRIGEVSASLHPGLYEFQFENTRYSVAAAKYLDVCVQGAADLAAKSFRVFLDVMDETKLRSSLGLASGNLDTQLGNIPTVTEFNDRTIESANYATDSGQDNILDSLATIETAQTSAQVDLTAIKAKTDDLTFTVANTLDANVQYINDTVVLGVGTSADLWRA